MKELNLKDIKLKRNGDISSAISKKLKKDKENNKEGVDLVRLAKELSERNIKEED